MDAQLRALVVYESMWGNTEKVARVVGQGLGGGGHVEVLDGELDRARAWGSALAQSCQG